MTEMHWWSRHHGDATLIDNGVFHATSLPRIHAENPTCFECGGLNPMWASIQNAVIICIDCASGHRGFGVHISSIRCLPMDSWTDKQIRALEVGGNKRAKEYFKERGIPYPSHDVFLTQAAVEYRSIIAENVEYSFAHYN